MLKTLMQYGKRPEVYEKSTEKFWDDPHIAKEMLQAHLDPYFDGATRKLDFVERSIGWIEKQFPPLRCKKVLDLGCGPGLYASRLSQKGYRVTGVDISENSIRYAKKYQNPKGNICYMVSDYLQADYKERFDFITMIYCDFGVLAAEERMLLLKNAYQWLLPGGYFLFDVFTPLFEQDKEEFQIYNINESGFWYPGRHLELHSFYRYPQEKVTLNQHVIVTAEDVRCYRLWNHGFTQQELEEWVRAAGFRKVNFYADAAGKRSLEGSETLCVVAEK